jgi:hypothetical protein
MAVSCGTPTPATIRVVQIEPGPIPTLTASAPASISVARCDVTRDHLDAVGGLLDPADRFQHPAGVAVRGVDHDQVASRRDQVLGALVAVLAHRRRRRHPQAALLVLAGIREALRLLDVLHRDQADTTIILVDDQQLLDPVRVQQPLRLVA